METCSRRSTRSPRSPGFDLHAHAVHSDRLSPKKAKMASPRSSPAAAAAAAAEPANTNTYIEPQVAVSRKSSLAFILTGDEEDEQEVVQEGKEDQGHKREVEEESGGEGYSQGRSDAYGNYQQEYINRNSSYGSQRYSSQYIRHYELEQQPRHQQLYHQQQHYQQQFQGQQQQYRYPPPPPAAAFSAPQCIPRASFPLEPRAELSSHSAQVDNDKWTETQPRKKGSKFCIVPGCISRAKHTRLCWKHGGSVKCKVPTCSNRAKSKGVCWSHGGGTICSFDDCSTISVSNGVCWAHGGGKRCVVKGCERPSYERTGNLCSVHFAESVV